MRDVKCLYLEHEPEHSARFSNWMRRAWALLDNGIPFDIEPVFAVEDAVRAIETRADSIHLLVADILFDNNEPLGLRAISAAKRSSQMGIIALSIGDLDLERRAIAEGAHVYMQKGWLAEHDANGEVLKKGLLDALTKGGHHVVVSDSIAVQRPAADPFLDSVLDDIGVDVLRSLVAQLVSRPITNIEPRFVRPGLSGAHVLQVHVQCSTAGGRPPFSPTLLLKCSRDGTALASEAEKRTETDRFPPNWFVKLENREPVETSGWYAISAPFVSLTRTLRQYVAAPATSSDDIRATLHMVCCRSGLQHMQELSADVEQTGQQSVMELITPRRRALMLLAMSDMHALAVRHAGARNEELALVRSFVVSGRCGQVDLGSVPGRARECWSHGDLHSANVLVDEYRRPFVIDPANIRPMHWAADISRLIVDVVLCTLAPGVESYEWDSLEAWLSVLDLLFGTTALATIPSSAGLSGAAESAKFFVEMVGEIAEHNLTEATRWELCLAIAIELLRGTYRVAELPPPKRVLAYCGAVRAIRAAEAACPTGREVV